MKKGGGVVTWGGGGIIYENWRGREGGENLTSKVLGGGGFPGPGILECVLNKDVGKVK